MSGKEAEAQRQKASSPRPHSIWQFQESKSSLWRRGWDPVNFDLRDFMKGGKHRGLWGRDGQGQALSGTATSFSPSSFPGQDLGTKRPSGPQCCPPVRVWKAGGHAGWEVVWGTPWADREGEPRALTFIARDQRPAFGLEVGRDDVAEAVGQDMVCLVEDVLPAVGTGLEDREGFRAGKGLPRAQL